MSRYLWVGFAFVWALWAIRTKRTEQRESVASRLSYSLTSTVAAGNGFLSHGLYSGLARAAELILIQVRDSAGHIFSVSIHRALTWILKHGSELGVRIVSLSVSGDPVSP